MTEMFRSFQRLTVSPYSEENLNKDVIFRKSIVISNFSYLVFRGSS